MILDDSQINPMAVFAYNRLDMFKHTIAALQDCELAKQSELYIFSDDAKKDEDKNTIEDIREFTKNISGFKKLDLRFSEGKKGLSKSIMEKLIKNAELRNKMGNEGLKKFSATFTLEKFENRFTKILKDVIG